MTQVRIVRRASICLWRLLAAAVLPVVVAGLCIVTPVLAKSPTGDYAVFAQCPRFTPGVRLCIDSQVEGGEVTLGGLSVPTTKTATLQGGITFDEETEAETFVGALNGETLSKASQSIPGGLPGLVSPALLPRSLKEFFEKTIDKGFTAVNGTSELARPASSIGINTNNLVNEEGVGLSMPVKIHLENPFLGGECYIGSGSHPITWNLMTGRTKPPPPNMSIKGSIGDLEDRDEGKLIEITGTTVVDNSYAVPGATGCGGAFSSFIDPLIDAKIGLPSAAGRNTAILVTAIKETLAKTVVNSEK